MVLCLLFIFLAVIFDLSIILIGKSFGASRHISGVKLAIAACDPKVGRCRQLIELMKVCEYRRSMSFLILGLRSFP